MINALARKWGNILEEREYYMYKCTCDLHKSANVSEKETINSPFSPQKLNRKKNQLIRNVLLFEGTAALVQKFCCCNGIVGFFGKIAQRNFAVSFYDSGVCRNECCISKMTGRFPATSDSPNFSRFVERLLLTLV